MFDMICDPKIILNAMNSHQNLLVRQNLFSLQDLVEISRGIMLIYLEKCFRIVSRHIENCEVKNPRKDGLIYWLDLPRKRKKM